MLPSSSTGEYPHVHARVPEALRLAGKALEELLAPRRGACVRPTPRRLQNDEWALVIGVVLQARERCQRGAAQGCGRRHPKETNFAGAYKPRGLLLQAPQRL